MKRMMTLRMSVRARVRALLSDSEGDRKTDMNMTVEARE